VSSGVIAIIGVAAIVAVMVALILPVMKEGDRLEDDMRRRRAEHDAKMKRLAQERADFQLRCMLARTKDQLAMSKIDHEAVRTQQEEAT